MSGSDSDEDLFRVKFTSSKLVPSKIAKNFPIKDTGYTSQEFKEKKLQNKITTPPTHTSLSLSDDVDDLIDLDRVQDQATPDHALSPSPPPPTPPKVIKTGQYHESDEKSLSLTESLDTSLRTGSADTSLLDDDDSIVCIGDGVIPSGKRDVMVRVRCRSCIQRFTLKPDAQFSEIFLKMAQHESVPISSVKMYLNDCIVKQMETPGSVGLSPSDIIECLIVKQGVGDECTDPDAITVHVQGQGQRQKSSYKISKDSFLSLVMKKYAQEHEIPVSSLSFVFDGETISETDTAAQLDLDDGDCIDVVCRSRRT